MYRTCLFSAVIIFACCKYKYVRTQSAEDVQKLYEDKVLSNNPNIRPVKNQSHVVNISLNFNLISINSFNEVQEKLSFTAWMTVWWSDELLAWDKRKYGNVDVIWPPEDTVWKPNIAVKNTVDELRHLATNNNVLSVTSDGLVVWYPGSAFNTHCEVDTSNFPFDKQVCQVEIIIWGQSLRYLDLYPGSKQVGLNLYVENGEWIIASTSVDRVLQRPGDFDRPVIVVSIHMERRSMFIVISVVLPSFVLALLSVFVFAIPLDSGDKISFSVTILLAFGVNMSFIMDNLPKTSKHISSLVVYLVSNTTIGAVFVWLAILLTNLHYRDEKVRPIPKWLVTFSRQLERVFRLNNNTLHNTTSNGPNQQFHSSLKIDNFPKQEMNYSSKNVAANDVTWKDISNILDAAIFRVSFTAMAVFFVVFTSILYTNSL